MNIVTYIIEDDEGLIDKTLAIDVFDVAMQPGDLERMVLPIVQQTAVEFLLVTLDRKPVIIMPRKEFLTVYGPRCAREIESHAVGFVMASTPPTEGRDFQQVKP